MSPRIRKIGSLTVLMWMIGVLLLPVVGYVASKAIEVPKMEIKLKLIATIENEIKKSIERLSERNTIDHQKIVDELKKNTADIKAIQVEIGDHDHRIIYLEGKHECLELNGEHVWK